MTVSSFSAAAVANGDPDLTRELCFKLWSRISARLRTGEALITDADFQYAMEAEYSDLIGSAPPPAVQKCIGLMVAAVNRGFPETYLTQGIHNGVTRAFEAGVRHLNWDVAKVQAKGVPAIRRFNRTDNVRSLLDDMQVRLRLGDYVESVQQTVEVLDEESRTLSPQPAALESPSPAPAGPPPLTLPETVAPVEEDESPVLDPEIRDAVEAGGIEAATADRRVRQQERRRAALEEKELLELPAHLPAFVDQGLLTREDADHFVALREVDQQEELREIDRSEAEEQRDTILDVDGRKTLDRKVKRAVAGTVEYLQAFEALRRIHTQYDEALRFLIQQKQYIVEATPAEDRTPAIRGLMESSSLLALLIDVMERKDPEIRLLDVRLPPYNRIVQRGLEKIGNLTIKEEFIDELRHVSSDEMSERLNSPVAALRVQPAADMRCLISLIDHVVKNTPFRKKIRMLRVAQTLEACTPNLEEMYASAPDAEAGRQKAEHFLKRRLGRLFAEATPEETAEINRRSDAVVTAVEQTALSEDGSAAVVEQLQEQTDTTEDGELTEEEKKMGVQIGRVEMRVAGRNKRIPQKIMADPDNPEQCHIMQRDPETGELMPQMRRGAKRLVKRDRDGVWRLV